MKLFDKFYILITTLTQANTIMNFIRTNNTVQRILGIFKLVIMTIINNLIYENIRGFIYLGKLVKKSASDEEINRLIDTFKLDYLEGGWEILICINRTTCLLANIAGWIFVSPDNPLYFRVTRVWPAVYLIFVTFDKISQRFKGAQEYCMILLTILLGILVMNNGLKTEKYIFNEMWITFISFSQFCSIFMSLSWRKLIYVFWIIMTLFLLFTYFKYDNVPIILYVSICTLSVMFPVATMFYWVKLKETILLVKTNKELTHTIRTILQVFPEGVVIRSLDSISKNTITKFANDVAKNVLNCEIDNEESLKSSKVQPISSINESFHPNLQNKLNLSDFLNQQEIKLNENENKSNTKFIEQLIELKNRLSDEESKEINETNNINTEVFYYSMKTIKVVWENNQDSYLHVFIDTSQIKKLEEEKANNKYQQLMFASVSHELRTPLNAFINSLQLIGITIADMRKKISKYPEVAASVECLYPKFEKFF